MANAKSRRVMWLLNHTSARKFEIPMLKSLGFDEIFMPKTMPSDASFRSGSIDHSEDGNLTIPAADLAILNEADWYTGPSAEVWAVANRYFDAAFFIIYRLELLSRVARHFSGAAIWRVYGLLSHTSYSRNLTYSRDVSAWKDVRKLGSRFWFGEAYDHLHLGEASALADRSVYLPLGLASPNTVTDWSGKSKTLFFICPEIASNSHYRQVYRDFVSEFSEFSYAVGGVQPVAVKDPRVLGYVSADEHRRNMSEFRVLFYHSREPNHVHYHPFEAVQAGMPLIFMAGGLLDRLGGADLPGRCETVAEAKAKIRRIMNDDWEYIAEIRQTQTVLLSKMTVDYCRPFWRAGLDRIFAELEDARSAARPAILKKLPKIAVLTPAAGRRGDGRLAEAIAATLRSGSRVLGDEAEIALGVLQRPKLDPDAECGPLPQGIVRRPFVWRRMKGHVARHAMAYAGHDGWVPDVDEFQYPEDGMAQFCDCDLWLLVSRRVDLPLLPVRPAILIVDGFLERYCATPGNIRNIGSLAAARRAERVLVTSEAAARDARQYAGVDPERIRKVPRLIVPVAYPQNASQEKSSYFVCVVDSLIDEGFDAAARALAVYYMQAGGRLECRVIGPASDRLLDCVNTIVGPHALSTGGEPVMVHLRSVGQRSDAMFDAERGAARFVWLPAMLDADNTALLAGRHPVLARTNPAAAELEMQLGRHLSWIDAGNAVAVGNRLKSMEDETEARGGSASLVVDDAPMVEAGLAARQLWTAVRECL